MYKTTTLKNGLKLITAPMRGTKTATILVIVGTGSKYEDKSNNGISHFLEHMFFKGSKKRPTTFDISSELDGIGAEFNAYTGKEYTGYWVKSEAAKIELGIDIVSDMLLNPKMSEVELKREKGVIIEELNMYLDNPIMHVEDIFEECLYGNTPAGWDTVGTRKNILSFKKKDFVDYLNSQYGTHNTTICLAGNIGHDEKKIKRMINKHFSSHKFAERGKNFNEKKRVVERQRFPQSKVEYKKTDQAHLILGCRAYGYNHQDRTVARLMSIILGGSMSSRLFINLRERNGLAYYVSTNAESYTDSGYVATRAGVPVVQVPKAIKIIIDEYKKIKKTIVGPEELNRAKELLKGKMAIRMESSESVANWYGRQAAVVDALHRLDENGDKKEIFSPDEYLKEINKITSADIKRVAGDIFTTKNLNLAVIGPFKKEGEFKGLLKL